MVWNKTKVAPGPKVFPAGAHKIISGGNPQGGAAKRSTLHERDICGPMHLGRRTTGGGRLPHELGLQLTGFLA